MSSDLETSRRFTKPVERRDFLGLAAVWSTVLAVGWAVLGALRLPIPWVLPESSPRVKLGPLSQFLEVEVTPVPEQRMWVYWEKTGLYAISAVCTHLGCIVAAERDGFFCPCHGSRFDSKGNNVSGPAPRPLLFLELTVSPDGQLVVNQEQEVPQDARLKV